MKPVLLGLQENLPKGKLNISDCSQGTSVQLQAFSMSGAVLETSLFGIPRYIAEMT